MRALAQFGLFYAGWMSCVFGAARGWGTAGALIAVPLGALIVGVSSDPRRAIRTVLAVTVIGVGFDLVQVNFGMIRLREPLLAGFLLPGWLAMLWVLFSATLVDAYRFLFNRLGLAAVLGAIFGPLSYWAGAKLGAIDLHPALWPSLVAFAVEWAVMFPLSVWIASRHEAVLERLRETNP